MTSFIITAMNAAGCLKSDTVDIIVRAQNTFSINAPSPVCPDDSVQLIAQGGDTYSWLPSAGINSTIANPFVHPLTTTIYTVQVTDTVCNQSQNLSTQVVVRPVPNVQAFKQNDIDCIQTTARLNAIGAASYKWIPAASLDNPDISNPTASSSTTTLFTVEGTDAFGCKNRDTISVVVDFSNKNGLFFVPNAFTPNNDGLNDCFGIKHWGVLESVEFNVYNRWGELVFRTTDVTKCWDGKWKGREQDPAVFVYWIKAKSICGGDIFRKGTVVLIR
jgi:gliding motility-associated-like protein